MRNAARALVTLGFVGICAAIFYLTAQGPTESVALSSRFDAFLKSVVAHTGSDGLLAQLVQQIPMRRGLRRLRNGESVGEAEGRFEAARHGEAA